MSVFGKLYKISTFGESHSKCVGVTIDSPPPNMKIDFKKVQHQLSRRRPGQSHITTPRNEEDMIEILCGIENGITLGTPLTIIVRNKDFKPEDYKFTKENYIPRPSHADYTYLFKYGIHASSGGGRSSARETIGRVIAGAVADQILDKLGIKIIAFVKQIGDIKFLINENSTLDRDIVDKTITRCPDKKISDEMEDYISELKSKGDSIGGIIQCNIIGCPKGLGEPVFDKLEALLAHAMMSIPATKGIEFGSGFECVNQKGSIHNDPWYQNNKGEILTKSNNSGGIIGGISNGMDINMNVAFKPPATILIDQETADVSGNMVILKAKGRHDPCVVPRAVPIVEAMASIVILDLLMQQISRSELY